MANMVLTDSKILVGQYDFSTIVNQINVNFSANMLDVTTFGSGGTKVNRPGLFDVGASAKGFTDLELVGPSLWTDAALFGTIGVVAPLTVAPVGAAEGDRTFSFKSVNATYQPIGGSVGDMLEFEIDAKAVGSAMAQGGMAKYGSVSANGNGTGWQRGALTNFVGKRIYGVLHLMTWVTLTNIIVVIESAPAANFAAPTTRLTFATKSAVGWDWQEATPGNVTDAWWRAKWTISGSGSTTIFVALGVQP